MPRGAVPSPEHVVGALHDLVEDMPASVACALVYGSVAKGCHRWDSDVDALLVTEQPVSPAERAVMVRLYTDFVADLGLRPDDEYPVEMFPVEGCRRMLGLPAAGLGGLSPGVGPDAFRCSPDDAWEVLYALTTPHLVVTGERLVDQLRRVALLRLSLLANHWTFPA